MSYLHGDAIEVGTVEQLLIGMVDGQMLTREQLQALAQKIDANQTTNQENHHE